MKHLPFYTRLDPRLIRSAGFLFVFLLALAVIVSAANYGIASDVPDLCMQPTRTEMPQPLTATPGWWQSLPTPQLFEKGE